LERGHNSASQAGERMLLVIAKPRVSASPVEGDRHRVGEEPHELGKLVIRTVGEHLSGER
jgi:hypothetical protein